MHKRCIISALLLPQMLLLFTGCTKTLGAPKTFSRSRNSRAL